MAGTSNSITTHNVLSGVLNADNVISGLVNTAFNPAYALVTQAGAQIALFINNNDYKMYAQLKDKSGNVIYTSNIIDLPLETMVVDGRYDSNTKKLILVLDNRNEIEVPLEALISGLVNEDDLIANYYDKDEIDALLDGYWTKIELTQEDIDNWNAADAAFQSELFDDGVISVEDSTEANINNTMNKSQLKIGLKGNTSQESTTGKNLLNNQLTSGKASNLTYTLNDDKSITINGTNSSDLTVFVRIAPDFTLPAGTYTLSNSNSNVSNTTFIFYDDNWKFSRENISTKTFTEDVVIKPYIKINSGVTLNNQTIYPMIEKNSSATDYEPYTGGNPAPSPDYPYPINVVTGDNEVKVEGKNKFNPPSDYTGTFRSNVSRTLTIQNGVFNIGGSGGGTSYAITLGSSYTIQNGDYLHIFNDDNAFNIYLVDSSNNNIAEIIVNSNNKIVSLDSYAGQTIGSVLFYVNASQGNKTFNFKPMICDTPTATPYEPYQSQTYPINLGSMELCKIGDYQDYLYKDNGKWYKYGAINKIVFDGSENWQNWSILTEEPLVGFLLDNYVNYNNSNGLDIRGMANYFKIGANAITTEQGIGLRQVGDTLKRLYVSINNTIVSDLESFKTWLSTHNTTLYYVYATPTITPITDTTLIEQLDNLEKAYSYDTQTNISQTNQDKPFILDINAIADNVNGLKLENENQEYKTNKVIELSSNSTDDEYPSAKCVYDIVGNIEAVLAAMDSGSGV